MTPIFRVRKKVRKSFYKPVGISTTPNLIELQRRPWERFIPKPENDKSQTISTGLNASFLASFPIQGPEGKARLEYCHHKLDIPKYEVEECRHRGLTYAAPVKATFRLVVNTNGQVGSEEAREQEIYLGDLPIMTSSGTFIVNGVERVVVAQVHRSPGVFFDHDKGKTHTSGKLLFSARVIPYRGSWGSWLDFEFDGRDILYVRIDRRRKLPATTLLMAMTNHHDEDMTIHPSTRSFDEVGECEVDGNLLFKRTVREDILSEFYSSLVLVRKQHGWRVPLSLMCWLSGKASYEVLDAESGRKILNGGEKVTDRLLEKLKNEGVHDILVLEEELLRRYFSKNIFDQESGDLYVEAGAEVTDHVLRTLKERNVNEVALLNVDHTNVGPYLRDTLAVDRNTSQQEAIMDICRVLRPGEPLTLETSKAIFRSLFFDQDRYDLSPVGRVRMNARLNLNIDPSVRVLCRQDIVGILRTLLDLRDGRGEIDDIDSLANRRVRSIGELLENQFSLGLMKMVRVVRERMQSLSLDTAVPRDLINAKPVFSMVKEFFTSSQLSQFLDQINPLTEVTHKRRLSSLGPGGLSRERAGFEVRDVHQTHYGRICPIETPEGPNIGLINSLATHASINQYGFIETPYLCVSCGKVTDKVVYLSASDEGQYTIAQANARLDDQNQLIDQFLSCRRKGEFKTVPAQEVQLIDVSPKQLVSVAASLIPFLENDDANRALMGSNMQRQAVPLLQTEAPLVGTGIERQVAFDSKVMVVAQRSGIVDQVDASRIVIRVTEPDVNDSSIVDIYNLKKFQRSNQSTCINQRPLVTSGDIVLSGEVLADGHGTESGELALGRNVFVAFMSWNGFNYEDSIVLSERLVREDVFTSIHIEEFEVVARDTKLGPEEISRDIPNASEDSLRYLDEAGVISIGAEVNPGDILVGKVTPKGESPLTPEGRLLRSIFGEKAEDVRDTSLRVPPGVVGTVVEVRIFNRRGAEKDARSLAIEQALADRLEADYKAEKDIQERAFHDRLKKLFVGQKIINQDPYQDWVENKIIGTEEDLLGLSRDQLGKIVVRDQDRMEKITALKSRHSENIADLTKRFEDKIGQLESGDELQAGVLKVVKVFIASKRKIQVGDKMSGRHGNKGVVSTIVPEEDMPHLEDGTPVDVILNPLGVPSRMNVGQIFETHLGWALACQGREIAHVLNAIYQGQKCPSDLKQLLASLYSNMNEANHVKALSEDQLLNLGYSMTRGIPISAPVFESVKESDIVGELERAGLPKSGQVKLIDGQTGLPFDRPVTVGYIYLMKLNHMVDDKIHARSVGPYSLVTQQPLGGKAQFGGQRLGEMEVWALEAYGASYTLQEMLTVKSDDVSGRVRVYELVIRGDNTFETGIPESFNVLVKELRSLGMNLELGVLGESQQSLDKKET